jgi:hypothetical protein
VNDDLSPAKSWIVREHRSVELRGEFFNLFNHTNFGFPGSIVGTSQFGTISSTLNPGRQVQVAAKSTSDAALDDSETRKASGSSSARCAALHERGMMLPAGGP